ncbi:MAG: hypothetical protein M1834_007529 [Cirrosporium novae-zelandiae]|nr:MAG: hypothetical protein M1834_007529 [Cirrosporium novae-zelandiae]
MREFITVVRNAYAVIPTEDITANLQHHGINCRDETIEVSGNTVVKIAILSSSASNSASLRCGLVWYHGDGGVSGNRFGGLRYVTDLIQIFGIIVISVEYRLAPEHPTPVPQDDCYAALTWAARSMYDLGIDPERLMVGGSSAGAGLAASVVLRARDDGGIKLCGQLLINPMLEDRNETVPSYRCIDERIGSADVSPYVAPARAKDLSSLPSPFITVGSEEPFRDEASIHAERIRDSLGSVEINIWNGAYHAFENLASQAELSKLAVRTRRLWIAQTFGLENRLRDDDQTMIQDVGAAVLRYVSASHTIPSILLLKRAAHEVYSPSVFELPSRNVDPDDPTLKHALVREMQEETDLEINDIVAESKPMIFTTEKAVVDNTGREILVSKSCIQLNYVVSVSDSDAHVKLSAEEHSESTWATEGELDRLDITSAMRTMIREAFGWAVTQQLG